MKKILFCLLFVCAAFVLNAQPWMPAYNSGPVNLQDVINKYKAHPSNLPSGDDDKDLPKDSKIVKENGDYQFDRWVWYWKQHLDSQGNLVSPAKTWEEWKKYQASIPAKGSASRLTTGSASNWIFQGPDSTPGGYSGIGRMCVMAFHPTDPKTIYAGSAGGGLWKTVDSGYHWISLYSDYPTLGVSDIAINPLNPNTIYVATGDADGYSNFSMGVIKSTDGGATWNTTSINWTPLYYNWIRSIIINPLDTNKLVIATRGYIATSYDGCASYYGDTSGDYNQLLYHPTDTSIIYAARYPVSPDSSSQIMRSHDGGITWSQVTHFTDAQRINLAICPSSTNVVKAIVSNFNSGLEGIYSSTDTGATFTNVYYNDTFCTHNLLSWDNGMPSTACNGQGWYDLCIAMNPLNANQVVIGGVNTYYSNDGGATWQLSTAWYGSTGSSVATVHADKHCLKYNPIDNILYEACDGGLYRTTAPLSTTWENITNGMGITQFYKLAVDNGVPFCIAGAQDDGTKKLNAGVYSDVYGGDGTQCRIDYTDPYNTWYVSTENGSFNLTYDAGATFHNISSAISDTIGGIWVTPFIIHPTNNSTLLLGRDILFESEDMGTTWNAISPQFTRISQISQIAMTPQNTNYIYVLVQSANHYYNTIHYTTNYGATWDTITTYAFTNDIAGMVVDPKDPNKIWVTFSGYGSEKTASYNVTTGSWIMYSAASLPDVPVNCIIIDTFSSTQYIGTDVGVYYKDTTMTSWGLYSHNLPTVQVKDLGINYTTGELWACTYGRGVWKTVKHENPSSVSNVIQVAGAITVSPNPNKGSFTINTTYSLLKGQLVNVRMLNADGKTVWHGIDAFDAVGNLKVNITGLAAGTYICEVANDRVIKNCKVVIY